MSDEIYLAELYNGKEIGSVYGELVYLGVRYMGSLAGVTLAVKRVGYNFDCLNEGEGGISKQVIYVKRDEEDDFTNVNTFVISKFEGELTL